MPDDVVVERLGDKLPPHPVVMASGATPLPQSASPVGVVWPIQSITAEREPNWSQLPCVVQASTPAFAKTLFELASRISGLSPKLVERNEDRLRLHAAAVLTQNFSNLLWTMAEELLTEGGLDYRLLLPLARTHLAALEVASPRDLQTGPAARGDRGTMQRHEALMEGEVLEVYRVLSGVIHGDARGAKGA